MKVLRFRLWLAFHWRIVRRVLREGDEQMAADCYAYDSRTGLWKLDRSRRWPNAERTGP